MTNNIPQPPKIIEDKKPSNKITKILVIVLGAILVVTAGLFVAINLSTNKIVEESKTPTNNEEIEENQEADTKNVTLDSEGIPQAITSNIDVETQIYTATLAPFDKSTDFEFKIENQNKKIIAEGMLDPKTLEISTPLERIKGDTTLKIRKVNGNDVSEWVTADTFSSASQATSYRKPVEDVFSTPWMTSEGKELTDLETTVKVAWPEIESVQSYTGADPMLNSSCFLLNSDNVAPGELFPPIPGEAAEGYELKYNIYPADDGTMYLEYIWCGNQII